MTVSSQGASRHPLKLHVLMLLSGTGVVLVLFGHVLFRSRPPLLGMPGSDMLSYFYWVREYGFSEVLSGRLPLWNPYVLCGTPFLASFQTALFYPVNWLHLVLPLNYALNLEVVLHLCLLAGFTYWWATVHRLHPAACLLTAMVVSLGSACTGRSLGHLTFLAAVAWAPLLLVTLEHLLKGGRPAWVLVGGAAVCMQLLAGHPQHFYYTFLMLCVYGGVRAALSPALLSLRLAGAMCAVYVCGAALASVQLLPGLDYVFCESVRQDGLGQASAGAFSLPPENLLLLLSPGLWGDMLGMHYWGRWNVAECSFFFGLGALFLAVLGSLRKSHPLRLHFLITFSILTLFALGKYTPLFGFLCKALPGFSSFRAPGRFNAYAAFFIAMLAGTGLDYLVRHRPPLRFCLAVVGFGLLLGVLGISVRANAKNLQALPWLTPIFEQLPRSADILFPHSYYESADFARRATWYLSRQIILASAKCLLCGGVLLALSRRPRLWPAFLLLAGAELVVYSHPYSHRVYPPKALEMRSLRQFLASTDPQERCLVPLEPNALIGLRRLGVGGYDPINLERYGRYRAFACSQSVDCADANRGFTRSGVFARLTRCAWFLPEADSCKSAEPVRDPLPVAYLTGAFRTAQDQEQALLMVAEEGYDPVKTTILETLPIPEPPQNENRATVRILSQSAGRFAFAVTATEPVLLNVTEAYSKDWRCTVRNPSGAEHRPPVLPANGAFMAVALPAGDYEVSLHYQPALLATGALVSLVSLAIWLGLLACALIGRQRTRRPAAATLALFQPGT